MQKESRDNEHNFEVEFIFNKHMQFISGPMEGKTVRTLPGIEETLGERLEGQGYMYASQLYEQFLVMKKDKFMFQYWMGKTCNATYLESANVYYALQAWHDLHGA